MFNSGLTAKTTENDVLKTILISAIEAKSKRQQRLNLACEHRPRVTLNNHEPGTTCILPLKYHHPRRQR
jgi:hypothetical protein